MSNNLRPHGLSPPGSSIHWIFQARVLEWVFISFSRGSSWPRDWTRVSRISCRRFYHLSHHTLNPNACNEVTIINCITVQLECMSSLFCGTKWEVYKKSCGCISMCNIASTSDMSWISFFFTRTTIFTWTNDKVWWFRRTYLVDTVSKKNKGSSLLRGKQWSLFLLSVLKFKLWSKI